MIIITGERALVFVTVDTCDITCLSVVLCCVYCYIVLYHWGLSFLAACSDFHSGLHTAEIKPLESHLS